MEPGGGQADHGGGPKRCGQKWRIVAQALPGRSDDSVRNRWKRLSALEAEAKQQANAVAGQMADALGFTPPPSIAEESEGSLARAEWSGAGGGAAAASGAATAAKPAKPKVDRLAWSKAEDAEIVRSVQQHGLKWGRISQNLPGRTAHAIRNRFHRLQTLQVEQAAAARAASQPQDTAWKWQEMDSKS